MSFRGGRSSVARATSPPIALACLREAVRALQLAVLERTCIAVRGARYLSLRLTTLLLNDASVVCSCPMLCLQVHSERTHDDGKRQPDSERYKSSPVFLPTGHDYRPA